MKILIIDSHKGGPSNNLHLQNAHQIGYALMERGHETRLIWSYKGVNDKVEGGYDAIVFNHSSAYSFVDRAWVEQSPEARLFFITNEYNLGEPRALWTVAKTGRKYTVIANHAPNISKVVTKYTRAWRIINLNALVAAEPQKHQGSGIVYYGSFRKDRASSFRRYLRSGKVTISTHSKNRAKYEAAGITGPFIDRINWSNGALGQFSHSLYIEDDTTHFNYNFLANRFYEALNHSVVPIFGFECINTMAKCGYAVPCSLVIDDPDNPPTPAFDLTMWQQCALNEKAVAMKAICDLITNHASG